MRLAVALLLLLASAAHAGERPPNRLRVSALRVEQGTRREQLDGMRVAVSLETVGFGGLEAGVQVWLSGPDGQPLLAPRGTPARYRDANGGVRVAAACRVVGNESTETGFDLFIPYRAIVPPGRDERRIGVWVYARCGGFNALAAEAGFLPPLRPPVERYRMLIESFSVTASATGLAVAMRVDGGAIRGGRLEAGFRMRARDGQVVRVRSGAPEHLVGERGWLDCRGSWQVTEAGVSAVPVRLEVPFTALDLERNRDHSLGLTAYVRLGGWRALLEQEVRFRIGSTAEPEVIPPLEVEPPKPERTRPGRDLELRLLQPSPEELAEPCRGGSGEYGLTSNLLRIELSAEELATGVHRVDIDLGEAGRRYVWVSHEKGETLVAQVPVASGPFRASLTVGGASVTFEGRMAAHAWAPSEGDLAEWRKALDEWRARENEDLDFVVGTLAQIAEGHLLRGDHERAEAACRECLELRPGPERSAELDRVLARVLLLQGKLAELDALYELRVREGGEDAALLREWAVRRSLLDPDPARSCEIWRRASREGADTPADEPAWLESR